MKDMDALIKRLEAAEKECYCLKVLDSARCEKINSYVITNARLAEERDALRAELAKQQALTEAAQKLAEIAQCRANDACAKIDAMEKQEPTGTLHDDGYFVWNSPRPHESSYAGWNMKLYAMPCAQWEPAIDTVVDYLVSISAHVAYQDDATAQAEIGDLLKMLAAGAQGDSK